MKTCFFIGHRDTPHEVMPLLRSSITRHITEYGVTRFVVGHYGNFDLMASRAVIEAKRKYNITLYMLLPYHPSERHVSVPDGFDGTLYLFEAPVPKRLAIVKANRLMIEKSDFLISYAHWAGNAKNLVDYAVQRESKGLIHTENLANV